jgi:8-oxo-dGTP pyrophosphatase MutT (NUDIX family)
MVLKSDMFSVYYVYCWHNSNIKKNYWKGEKNPGGDEIFHPPRRALGPTQPPANGYRVFPGGKVQPGRAADHSPPSSAVVTEE